MSDTRYLTAAFWIGVRDRQMPRQFASTIRVNPIPDPRPEPQPTPRIETDPKPLRVPMFDIGDLTKPIEKKDKPS